MFRVRIKCTHTDNTWHYYEENQDVLDATIVCPSHPTDLVSDFVIIKQFDSLLAYKCTGLDVCPKIIDINFHGLHKESVINGLGSLVYFNYYKNYDANVYGDLAIQDSFVYTINTTNDLVQSRVETINWYVSDGSVGCTKEFTKYYNLNEAIQEGMVRRSNIMNKAKAYGLATISGMHVSGLPNSHYFFGTMTVITEEYISGTNKQDIIDFINNTTEPYITQIIKDTWVAMLDYWTV